MALVIRTTGLEQYAPGGEARLKLLIIGGPGAGKTRYASFFPRPIYADCEAGLASVADRNVPYVGVNNSTDMLDLLTHLKQECRLPKDKRTYDTVVIDTLDAYQRKLKNEWMEREKKETFTGWDAWGHLNQKMGLLLTRLLNLDMNVIVNVHYKDKTTKDDETGKETHELMLQLQGETSDTAFNDFDQVGWMGTYWEAEGGERIQKRGLTFKPTPDKPFLKDRLHVTPKWMEVTFADEDYENLFKRVAQRLKELSPSVDVGEIPSAEPDNGPTGDIRSPDSVPSGALPAQAQAQLPLSALDKPSLVAKARQLGITTLPDGSPIKGNTLKAELISAIEHHQALPAADTTPTTAAPPATPAMPPRQSQAPHVEQVPEGLVDTRTGELLETGGGAVDTLERPAVEPATQTPDATAQAVDTVEKALSGTVIPDPITPQAPSTPQVSDPAPTDSAADPSRVCQVCGKDLSGEKPDYVKLAWIKYRARLCDEHFLERRNS